MLTNIVFINTLSDLTNRYLKGTLPKNSAPTIGVEFATKNVVLRNGGTVKA